VTTAALPAWQAWCLERWFALTRAQQGQLKPRLWVGAVLALGILLALITAVQPLFTILLILAVLLLAGLVWLWRRLAPGAPAWVKACLFVVGGQLVLSYGFANIIFFAGGAPLPLTDMVMLVALLASSYWLWLAREPVRLPRGLWLLVGWVGFVIVWHLPAGLRREGVGAARDAMPTIQMLYIVVGYVVVSLALRRGATGVAWLRSMLLLLAGLSAFYGLLYPVSSALLAFSPRLSSVQQSVPILGYYTTWPALGLLSILGLGLWRWQAHRRGLKPGWSGRLLGGLVLLSGLLTFFLLQARIAYLFIALCVPVLLFIGDQARQVGRLLLALALGLAVLGSIELSGVEFKGRVARLSVTGIYHHLATLAGASFDPEREFGGAAAGIHQRRQWRQYALGLWSQDASTLALGIGYGHILTNLTTGGTGGETLVVREPHNSYVTVLTRTGAVGLTLMLVLHGAVLLCSLVGYRRNFRSQPAVAAAFLGLLFFEFYSLLNAWGEPHFEVAYWTVPSYFVYGAGFALWSHFGGRPVR
jgi:hypothetical protein